MAALSFALREHDGLPPELLVDPASLQVLLVDASSTSRQDITALLRECGCQVTACKTSQDAIQILKAQRGPQGTAGFDLILKEHSPASGTNACRFLRRCQTEAVLQGIPVIVASNTEDRDVMVNCLQLGAADYMLKPLRSNELRNLWARVYWWRRASYLQQQQAPASRLRSLVTVGLSTGSDGSEETKCGSDEDDQPQVGMAVEDRSGEGSAPVSQLGKTSNGNGSKNGSKEALGWSGTQVKSGVNDNSQDNELNANSALPAEQGSNHPSGGGTTTGVNSTQKPKLADKTQPSFAEGSLYPPVATGVASRPLAIAPLNTEGSKSASPFKAPGEEAAVNQRRPEGVATAAVPALRAMPSASGFRAYVPVEPRKRPAEAAEAEDGGRSSGSERTASIEKVEPPTKRQSLTRLGSSAAPLQSCTPSGSAFRQPNSKWAGSQPDATPAPPVSSDLQSAASRAWSQGSCQPASSGFGPFYPYGMMPSPFGLPSQMWPQVGSGVPSNDAANMQQFLQLAQQLHSQSNKGQMPNLQQQQMAMHSQLMFQHTMLMQQYGIQPPPFPSGFPGKPTSQTQGSGCLPERAASQPAPQQMAQRLGSTSKDGISELIARCKATGSWNPAVTSGMLVGATAGTGTGTGPASGNTLGPGGNVTGATSNATAQVGPDGCLTEPSRKERRAQALHKYKQKRKNLCFTKKIRYESRKQLAQARPRVKGQFVRVRSGDMEEVVHALEKQKGNPEAGAAVPQIAMEKAGGNAEIAAELVEAAVKKLAGRTDTDHNSEEVKVYAQDEFEEDDFEEDDVNSAPTVPTQPAKVLASAAQGALQSIANQASRHSSNSGSNSLELTEQ